MALTGPRKEFGGNAKPTTLSGALAAGALSFSVATGGGANYPTGASYPFVMVIDRGLAAEEKLLCASRSGDAFTVTTRGYDGTSNQDHAAGAKVEHAVDSIVFSDLHRHLYDTTEDQHTQYLLRSLLTGKGYIYVATASGIIAALAPGTDFQRLRARAGATAGIEWADVQSSATVATQETTTSTTFTDLATAGPTVSNLVTGTSALVLISSYLSNNTNASASVMGVAVSGAGTVAAADAKSLQLYATGVDVPKLQVGTAFLLTGLTAGTNTFTAKYHVAGASTGTFANRNLTVIPV